MADSNDYTFELFISYATNPDYSLARKLESFLETFHNLPTPENLSLTPLRICVDGSDFHTVSQSSAGSEVGPTIETYLAKSKELLVLCSTNARKSKWVDQEIRWFLKNRGPNAIRVAFTEGEDPNKLDEVYPQAILEEGLHKRIAYDFRGVHKRAGQKWQAVRDFDDERTRLAADLYGRPPSEIRPIWFREQRQQARKRTRIFIVVSLVLLALLVGTIYFYFAAEAERKRTLAESERTRRQFYVASMNLAQRALNEGSVPLARQLLEAQQPHEGQEDLRDFDWSYLLRRTKAEKSHLFAKDVAFQSVSVSADGSLVAGGGRLWTPKNRDDDPSSYVYVWSLQRGDMRYVLKGHADSITAVKFSPTAPVLASGSEDGMLKIWNAESGTEIRSIEIGSVNALAYSTDGSVLAVSGGAGINLFNTTTWESAGTILVYHEQASMDAITFSPDGKFLVAGGMSKKVSLWDVATRKMIEVVGEHEDTVLSAAWSPQSNLLATGGADGVVILWDMNKKKEPVRLHQNDGAHSLAFTPDGKLLAVGLGKPLDPASGKTIALWNVSTGTRCGLLKGHPRRIESLVFTPSGDSLVSVGEEETIRIWDVQTASFLAYSRDHRLPIWALAYSPDGKMIASGDGEGRLRLWTLESGLSVELAAHDDRVVDLSFDPANRLLASVGWDGTLRIWQPASTSEPQVLLQTGRLMTAVTFAPDGSKLGATNCDGNIYLWDAPNFKSLPGLKQTGCPSFLAWSPDSTHFVTGGGDPANRDSPRSVFLWRAGAPEPIKILEGHSSWPTSAPFSPDGKYVVTGSWDGEMILWDFASGTARHTMRGHTELVTAVMFSPSGKIIASSSTDNTLRLWDPETGQERAALTDDDHSFFAMRFHPSGQILAAAGSHGRIVQWIADKSPLITIASPQ